MRILKCLFNFYLQGSLHVALSVYALVRMTQYQFHIPYDKPLAWFAFWGTVVGYNFVKYDALIRTRKLKRSAWLKAIVVLSRMGFLAALYCFFYLQRSTQAVAVGLFVLTLLYALPFPNKKNARNWAGIKIYIVAFCWVGVTLFLPLLNTEVPLTSDFYLKSVQRFLLIFVLILIFEIIDLSQDDLYLKTVPQQIGVKRTKIVGLLLLLSFYLLELLKTDFNTTQLLINFILIISVAALLLFAHQKRTKYYTSFWVESIPVFWWILVLILGLF